MAARSPARFLAPLAIVAVGVALWVIVEHGSSGSGTSGSPTTEQRPSKAGTAKTARRTRKQHAARFYTVKPGDTPSGIAAKTHVPLSRIESLNPGLDPQALSPGTRLKLRG